LISRSGGESITPDRKGGTVTRNDAVFRVKGDIVSTATREPWMVERGLDHTVVCGRASVAGELEKDITEYFDRLLNHLYFGSNVGITKEIEHVACSATVPVLGRVARKGERSIQSLTGNVYDLLFKNAVNRALSPHDGQLHQLLLRKGASRSVLEKRPPIRTIDVGAAGPDVIMEATNTAWDVTTIKSLGHHFTRDVIGREFDRYYLLIYDAGGALPRHLVDWDSSE
jgi:hypothetical protein